MLLFDGLIGRPLQVRIECVIASKLQRRGAIFSRVVFVIGKHFYRSRQRESTLYATSTQNEVSDSLSDEAKETIISAMNSLPDDVMSYVMAYTPVRVRTESAQISFLANSDRVEMCSTGVLIVQYCNGTPSNISSFARSY